MHTCVRPSGLGEVWYESDQQLSSDHRAPHEMWPSVENDVLQAQRANGFCPSRFAVNDESR